MAGADVAHNRRDALAIASRALSRYLAGTESAQHQFDNALNQALATAERVLALRRTELERALAALAAADEHSVAGCRRRVNLAEQRVAVAANVVGTIRSAFEQFRSRRQRFTALANDVALKGQAKLRALDQDLDRYLAARSGSLAGSPDVANGGTGVDLSALGTALAHCGLEEVSVSGADYSDNPVISWVHATRADVEWAVDRWEMVVSKVVSRGGSRDELAERDAWAGTTGTMRQLAGVWDMFMGSDAITLSEDSNGDLTVIDGRHRLLVAAEMGVERLPGRVIRRDRS